MTVAWPSVVVQLGFLHEPNATKKRLVTLCIGRAPVDYSRPAP